MPGFATGTCSLSYMQTYAPRPCHELCGQRKIVHNMFIAYKASIHLGIESQFCE